MTTSSDTFEQELALEDIGYKSGSEMQIFPLFYAMHHGCTMFQHKKIYPLDQPLLDHAHLLVPSTQCTAA